MEKYFFAITTSILVFSFTIAALPILGPEGFLLCMLLSAAPLIAAATYDVSNLSIFEQQFYPHYSESRIHTIRHGYGPYRYNQQQQQQQSVIINNNNNNINNNVGGANLRQGGNYSDYHKYNTPDVPQRPLMPVSQRGFGMGSSGYSHAAAGRPALPKRTAPGNSMLPGSSVSNSRLQQHHSHPKTHDSHGRPSFSRG